MATIKSTVQIQDTVETPSPRIGSTGNWEIWDLAQGKYIDTGKPSQGVQGPRGLQGIQGEKGEQGIRGPIGATGAKGPAGASSYTHIAYADNASGGGFSQNPAGKIYIGMYVDNLAADSSDPTKYLWTKYVGSDGAQGVPGAKGADGKTPYLHIAYATNSTGTAGFSTTSAAGKTYIGTYTDYTATDSTNPATYTWALIKGDKGDTGAKGATGAAGADAVYVSIHAQGEFRQRINAYSPTGAFLTTPTKTPYVIGGYRDSSGKDWVRLTAQVIKGGADVTANALAKGGVFQWMYKGAQIATGKTVVDLDPATYADGNMDEFVLTVTTTRAAEW